MSGQPTFDITRYQRPCLYADLPDPLTVKAGTAVFVTDQAMTYVAYNGAWNAQVAGYRKFTASGTFTVPAGITRIRVRAGGGGGGGGGGGSALSSGGVNGQAGGGGGGAGQVVETELTVAPGDTVTVTIGAGGTAGTAGALNGNAGGSGGAGSNTTVVDGSTTIVAAGGGAGVASASNNTSNVNGGCYGFRGQNISTPLIPGCGGRSTTQAVPLGAVVGGAGGGWANATLGGGGGSAAQAVGFDAINNGGTFSQGSAPGGAGQTALAPGCGGGGGGGGAPTGAGGAGGAGAAGLVELFWTI